MDFDEKLLIAGARAEELESIFYNITNIIIDLNKSDFDTSGLLGVKKLLALEVTALYVEIERRGMEDTRNA